MTFTHRQLVDRAERWLRHSAVIPDHQMRPRKVRCSVVLAERATGYENPDAIGWAFQSKFSILIECKVSRADFISDRNKYFRHRLNTGMGRYRYYMVPKRLVKLHEVPMTWGLIEVSDHRSYVTKLPAEQPDYSLRAELHMLWSELARYQMVWHGTALWPARCKQEIEGCVAYFKEQERAKGKYMMKLKRRKRHV